MNNIEKQLARFSISDSENKCEYAMYLYNKLLTPENADVLGVFSETLLEIASGGTENANNPRFDNNVLEAFYYHLIKKGKRNNTAYDYVRRIGAICKEFNVDIGELYSRKSACSIDDLIGMYSKGGVKNDENVKRHNSPLSALKQFSLFMDETAINVNDVFLYDERFYLSSKGGTVKPSGSANPARYHIEIQRVPHEKFGTIKLYDSSDTLIAADVTMNRGTADGKTVTDDLMLKCLLMLIKADPNEQTGKVIDIIRNEFSVSLSIDDKKIL